MSDAVTGIPPHVEEVAFKDPLRTFAPFASRPWSVFLDSARPDGRMGRHAFICIEPFLTLTVRGGHVYVDGKQQSGDPFDLLQDLLARHSRPALPDLPPFQGGAAGFLGYELGGYLERLPPPGPSETDLPDLALGFYDTVLAFDLIDRRAWIFSAEPNSRADEIRQALQAADNVPAEFSAIEKANAWTSNFTADSYRRAIARTIDYILAGDIFQANIAQRFAVTLPTDFDRFGFYRQLRGTNPAPFAAFMELGGTAVASSSPERFLTVRDGTVETRPIKGTRPRHPDPVQDAALADALQTSEKDRAENVMIVDLLRNDLSRVCADNTVEVPELCTLESYATVHHLVSAVTGQLRPGKGPVDLLRAAFPGGSVTGAPKVRAMEIIAEIEPHRRGPYCGGIGYIGFDGTMDMNVAIRTVTLGAGKAIFHAGGGIVADSDPQAEYAESLDKARALFAAFGLTPPGG